MSDVIDQAQRQSELILARELKNAQRHNPNTPSATHCTDCSEAIPELRRQTIKGCTRCVACQSDFEQFQKQLRR
ncbi:TraR/DksA C4-type zinc finger protein [Moraxella catarrhalis]|uniref:TraR/DksA C4-type zinc finger protein n=1 Tax=Moraxella catarrhalis TaxID=480 RepID=UPI0007F4FD24|nr:TraR/DksA C4-type zinc finger protein [Moraxella catarrhalis]OAV05913.1 hypothetical protein AO380_1290 [Moraxella catarrhalis]OAV09581.1 hypothetical protein AO378_1260 [Moraxella catarrhalis]OAV23652.1 hypothetical protein AO371_1143 [Moraxella catarrhalis]OAV31757.1 hypothetical protein AO367_0277 [Moraxella catarrhalis]